MVEAFRQRLADGDVIVIDGGMGPELARRGVPMHPVAWAGPAALTHADIVRAAHADYIRAGAEAIITNTFMASRDALEAAGMGDDVVRVNTRSAELAREARDQSGNGSVLIAGAMFPGYFHPQTNEIVPEPTADADQIADDVREQATALVQGGADVIALEMIPSAHWARAALVALADVGRPVWLGVSKGTLLLDDGSEVLLPMDTGGDVGRQIAQILDGSNADVMAVNVMHTELEDVAQAITDIRAHWDGVVGAYPHHGIHTVEPPYYGASDDGPEVLAGLAAEWVADGVQLLGGCCGIGPEHIRMLSDQLPRRLAAQGR